MHFHMAGWLARAGVAAEGFRVQRSVTIGQSPEDVYCFVRDFEMLPRFVPEVERVRSVGEARYRFKRRGSLGAGTELDVQIIEDLPGKRILWRSAEPRRLRHAGAVYFTLAPGARGTELKVVLDAPLPGGALARIAAVFRGGGLSMKLRGALRRCKQLIETGEIPTTAGQPSGRKGE